MQHPLHLLWLTPLPLVLIVAQDAVAVLAPVPTTGGRFGYALREVGALLAYRLGVFR